MAKTKNTFSRKHLLAFALSALASVVIFNELYLKLSFARCPVPEITSDDERTIEARKKTVLLIFPAEFNLKNEVEKIAISSKKLNWKCYTLSYHLKSAYSDFDASLIDSVANGLRRVFRFSFAITLQPSPLTINFGERYPNYLYLPENVSHVLGRISADWSLNPKDLAALHGGLLSKEANYRYIYDYDGYLYSTKNLKWLERFDLKKYSKNSSAFPSTKVIMRWYLSSPLQKQFEQDLSKITMLRSARANILNEHSLKQALDNLELDGVLQKNNVYGDISFSIEREQMKAAGVSLIINSKQFRKNGIISTDLLASTAMGNIIIADKNSILESEFNKCILYVDSSSPAESVIDQIKTHYTWIAQNKSEAQKLANCAHEIFANKFSLEQQLLNLVF